jgi:hypothetical protein
MAMKDLLKSLDTLVEIEVPTGSKFNVCGDVHGFSSQVARF